VFAAARGVYVAVVPSWGGHGGCMSAGASPGSGASLTVGLAADQRIRQQGLNTVCPAFSVQFEDKDTVRIDVPEPAFSGQKKVVAHIPIKPMDAETAPFARHDVKGVKLGPIAAGAKELGPLTMPGYSEPQHRGFQRAVGSGRLAGTVLGRAAAAATTGWRTDVLYSAQYTDRFEQKTTAEAFRAAVLERYGNPGFEFGNSGYMVWLYDTEAQPLRLDDAATNPCRATAEFWLEKDGAGRPMRLKWDFGGYDLGPWGCSLIMELFPNRDDGGISGYNVRTVSGHAMAVNHFMQRIDQAKDVMARAQALLQNRPRL
jgi:hypothetical protein